MANRSRPSFDWRRSLQWHLSRSIQPIQDWVVSDANSWRHLDMHVCSVSAFPLRNARSCIAHCLGDYYGRKAHWNCNFFIKSLRWRASENKPASRLLENENESCITQHPSPLSSLVLSCFQKLIAFLVDHLRLFLSLKVCVGLSPTLELWLRFML